MNGVRSAEHRPGTPRRIPHLVSRAAFSLIELLIVMVLILLMYATLYGPWTGNFQNKAKIECAKNLQKIHLALKIYATEHGGRFPEAAGADSSEMPLSLLVPKCTAVTEIFICPGSGDGSLPEARPFAKRKISYAYVTGLTETAPASQLLASDEQVNVQPKAAGEPLFSANGKPPGAKHRKFGGNLLFCDGHVEASSPQAVRDLPLPEGAALLNPKP